MQRQLQADRADVSFNQSLGLSSWKSILERKSKQAKNTSNAYNWKMWQKMKD